MICPDCHQGKIPVLATKGQVHPYRETSILTHPERYIKKVNCTSCNGSGITFAPDTEDASREADGLYGDHVDAGETQSLIA